MGTRGHGRFRPPVVAIGVVGGLAVEAAFLAGTPAVDLWEVRRVRFLAVALLVGGGLILTRVLGPWVLAAVCWGLCTYFAVLAPVLWRSSD